MEYSVANTLTIRFEDEEVSSFLVVLDKLKHETKRIGFKKPFDKSELDLIDNLYDNIVGNEEDSDKDK
jgi:hypothetical protein